MKIDVIRSEFMKAWQMAERCSSTRSTIGSLSGVLLTAEDGKVLLSATDLKTSICCVASGVQVSQDGSAILPVKLLGELFKKVSADRFSIEIKDEKGLFIAGRNKTRFSTWPVSDFPKLSGSADAQELCEIPVSDLLRALVEGSTASSPTDDFPKYLGACLLQLKEKTFQVISTDGRRLSLSKCSCKSECESELLLPVLPLRELQRFLGIVASSDPEALVRILYDGSTAWFQMGQIEFSVRRVESSFPNYEKILNPNSTTTMLVKRNELLSALGRIDIVVRSHTRLAVLYLSPGGRLGITGKAPEFGTAIEELDVSIEGEEMKAAFNVGFLEDGLKSMSTEDIRMRLNGEVGQMTLRREGDDDFLYMLMPARITEQDLIDSSEDDYGDFSDSPQEESDEALDTLKSLKAEAKEDAEG